MAGYEGIHFSELGSILITRSTLLVYRIYYRIKRRLVNF